MSKTKGEEEMIIIKKVFWSFLCVLGFHKNKEVLRQGLNIRNCKPRQYAHQCERCGKIEAFSHGTPVEKKFNSFDDVLAWATDEEAKRINFLNRCASKQKGQK